MKNSLGNVTEILSLLDEDKYTGKEIQTHYAELVARWGEWEIVGEGSAGLVVRYVDIGNALFSNMMVTYGVFAIISLCIAFIFGKIIFPVLAKHFQETNAEMVDVATLQSASKIEKMSKKEGWF